MSLRHLGLCPTADPPDDLADAWRQVVIRLMRGDPKARADAHELRAAEWRRHDAQRKRRTAR
jgi:hypothetical protein